MACEQAFVAGEAHRKLNAQNMRFKIQLESTQEVYLPDISQIPSFAKYLIIPPVQEHSSPKAFSK